MKKLNEIFEPRQVDLAKEVCDGFERALAGSRMLTPRPSEKINYNDTTMADTKEFVSGSVEVMHNPDGFGLVVRAMWRSISGEQAILVLNVDKP